MLIVSKLRIANTTSSWGSSVEQAGQAQEPPAGCISTGERQEEKCQMGPFCTSLREIKYTGSQVPIPLRPTKQRDKINAKRGNQCSNQPWFTHRGAINKKQERADPLTQIDLSLETDSYFIRNCTLLIISWNTPRRVAQGQESTPTFFPEDSTVTPRRDPGVPPSQLHRSPLQSQVKAVHLVLPKVG